MYDNEAKLIQDAINDCLLSLHTRPSIKKRVLERIDGKRSSPRKISFAMVIVLLFTFLAATALAIGVFTGLFRIEQDKAGTFRNCVSSGDKLYVMTREGFHVWQPSAENLTVLITSEELQKNGLFFDTLLFRYDNAVGLLCQSTKTIWKYENGELDFLLDYSGSEFDIGNAKLKSVVYQDDYLFFNVTSDNSTIYDSVSYRLHFPSGVVERLDFEGILEFCNFQSGEILAIVGNRELNQGSLIAIDTASGEKESTLYTTTLQGIEGIAYDVKNQQIYAIVKGTLAKWNGESWDELQGYSSHHLADSYAIVDGGFVSVSYDDMQYLPFADKDSIPTLNIRGYIAMGNEDADFQEEYPLIAVVRERDPALTASDVQQAIEAGDTTDLFHVKLDFDLIAMYENGQLVPLTSSKILLDDATEMLPVFQNALFVDGQLFAVPSMAAITVWSSEETLPNTFAELVCQHSSQKLYIAHHWAQEAWGKPEYADYLLTTYIAEATKLCGRVNFNEPSFRKALELLRDTPLPVFGEGSSEVVVSTSIALSLSGTSAYEMKDANQQMPVSVSVNDSFSRKWALPCRIGEDAMASIPVRMNVYVLNPHAENPDAALRYLEYIATHRFPEEEAILKPDIAIPALHPGVQKQIDGIVKEQCTLDAEHGVATDERALQMRIDAISSDPAAWAVAENLLAEYKKRIVPYLDLRISPLLCSSAKQEKGVYSEMNSIVTTYVEGTITLDMCIKSLEELAAIF